MSRIKVSPVVITTIPACQLRRGEYAMVEYGGKKRPGVRTMDNFITLDGLFTWDRESLLKGYSVVERIPDGTVITITVANQEENE